jgi:hypothetical protein
VNTDTKSPAFNRAIVGMLLGCIVGILIELVSPDGKRRHSIMPSFCALAGLLAALMWSGLIWLIRLRWKSK